MNVRWLYVIALAVVIGGWFWFAWVFLFSKKPARERATQVDRASVLGIVVQGVAYTLVWMLQRPRFTPIVPLPGFLAAVPPLAAMALSVVSVRASLLAIRTLGREWSYGARLLEGHRLVTGGPYSVVRHPIYSALIGKLVATAIVISHWIGLLAGVVLISIGTAIRVRSEEKLLRASFGAEYDDYASRVPAIVPRLWPTRPKAAAAR